MADSELVKSVLIELLGKDHKAVKLQDEKVNEEQLEVQQDSELQSVSRAAYSCKENFEEFLIESTGESEIHVLSFKTEGPQGFRAELVFPCYSVEHMDNWVEDFERASGCALRQKLIEKVRPNAIVNVHKARRKCAFKSVRKSQIADRCYPELVNCDAGVTSCLKKDGFAHICIDMVHNHSLKDDSRIWARSHLSQKQKQLLTDLFRAGLTPVQVLDYLKTIPVDCGERCFPVVSNKEASNGFQLQQKDHPRNLSYHQVYHAFKKFKEQSSRECVKDFVKMRTRLEHDLDVFKSRLCRSEMLMASAQCFLGKAALLSDRELTEFLMSKPLTSEANKVPLNAPKNLHRKTPEAISNRSHLDNTSRTQDSGIVSSCEDDDPIAYASNVIASSEKHCFDNLITFDNSPRKPKMPRVDKCHQRMNHIYELGCFESPIRDSNLQSPAAKFDRSDATSEKVHNTPPEVNAVEIVQLEDETVEYPGYSSPIEVVDDLELSEFSTERTPAKEHRSKTSLAQKAFMETLMLSAGKKKTPVRQTNFLTPTKATPKDIFMTPDYSRPHKMKPHNYNMCNGKPTISLEDLLKTPPTTGPFSGPANFTTPGSIAFSLLEEDTSVDNVENPTESQSSIGKGATDKYRSKFPSNFSPTSQFLSQLPSNSVNLK